MYLLKYIGVVYSNIYNFYIGIIEIEMLMNF